MSENEPPKEPLPYRSGFDDYAADPPARRVAFIIGGIVGGLIVPVIVGAISISPFLNFGGPGSTRTELRIQNSIGIFFWLITVVSAFFIMREKHRRRWGLMGFCIGLSVGFLVEGFCFVAIR